MKTYEVELDKVSDYVIVDVPDDATEGQIHDAADEAAVRRSVMIHCKEINEND